MQAESAWSIILIFPTATHIPAHFPLRSGDAECTQLRVSFIPFTPSSLLPPLAICFPGLPALQSEPVLWSLPLAIRSLLPASAKSCWLCWWCLAERCGSEWELGTFFYQLRMSESAEICPRLSASLYLVYSEGSAKFATPLGQLENVAASDSSLHPAGGQCLLWDCVLHAWVMMYELPTETPSWIPGRELRCHLEKQQQQRATKNEICSVARIITWSWKCEEILKEPLQPKHSSADWFADRGQKNGASVLISDRSLLPQDQRRMLFAESS